MKKQTIQAVSIIAASTFGVLCTTVEARSIADAAQPARLSSATHAPLILPLTLIAATLAAGVGLYDGNDTEVTSGELNSQDYWWTKYDAMMLDIALKQRQPEGRIGMNIAIALRRIDDLQKKYPKHEEIKKWKARFEEIQSKINPDANRSAGFTKECPWDESNFAQLWVNVHWAKFAASQGDWPGVSSLRTNVQQNYKIMLAPDRMNEYPEELRKWVTDSKPEADKLFETAKAKTG